MTSNGLEERLRRLEDIREVELVYWRYAEFADRGWAGGDDGQAWADLFSEDAVLDTGSDFGVVRGRGQIDEWQKQLAVDDPSLFSVHLLTNPRVEVDGDRATAWLHVLIMMEVVEGHPTWLCGKTEDKLVRTAEGWKLQECHMKPAFVIPYVGEGWTKANRG